MESESVGEGPSEENGEGRRRKRTAEEIEEEANLYAKVQVVTAHIEKYREDTLTRQITDFATATTKEETAAAASPEEEEEEEEEEVLTPVRVRPRPLVQQQREGIPALLIAHAIENAEENFALRLQRNTQLERLLTDNKVVFAGSSSGMNVDPYPTDADYAVISEWFLIRRDFTRSRFTTGGGGDARRSRMEAFSRLEACKHPDAVWLFNVLVEAAGNYRIPLMPVLIENVDARVGYQAEPSEPIGMRRLLKNTLILGGLFASLGNAHKGAAKFFASCFCRNRNLSGGLVKESANLGYAPAQVWVSQNAVGYSPREQFEWAERSANQWDPEGLYALGHMYLNGLGCVKDPVKGSVCMMNAARAGHPSAQSVRARVLPLTDPERVTWFHRAALGGSLSYHYGGFIASTLRDFTWDTSIETRRVIFEMGRVLRTVIDYDAKTLYADTVVAPESIETKWGCTVFDYAVEAVCLYAHWTRKTREALDTWTLVALRLNKGQGNMAEGSIKTKHACIPRDIRKLIGEYVWASRVDGLYNAAMLPRDRPDAKRIRLDDDCNV